MSVNIWINRDKVYLDLYHEGKRKRELLKGLVITGNKAVDKETGGGGGGGTANTNNPGRPGGDGASGLTAGINAPDGSPGGFCRVFPLAAYD